MAAPTGTILPWEALQESIFAILTSALEGTAAKGKVYSSVPEDTAYPYVLIGQGFSTTETGAKSSSILRTVSTIEIFSLQESNEEAQRLASKVLQSLTSGDIRPAGPTVCIGQAAIEQCDLIQETDGAQVRWHSTLRLRFLSQQ